MEVPCQNSTSKKIPETDAIFEQLAIVHQEAIEDPSILRLSLDAKARVNIGSFDRAGRNRAPTKADAVEPVYPAKKQGF